MCLHMCDQLEDKERQEMKREYAEYKVTLNALVAKALKTPRDRRSMQDETPWIGNNP